MIFYLMLSGNSIYNLEWCFLIAVLVAGAVCSSRLILGRHTLGQVAAGCLNGFVCVFIPAIIFQSTPVVSSAA